MAKNRIMKCNVCRQEFNRDEYDVGHDFCSMECSFWDKVKVDDESGCWRWTSKLKRGYPQLKWKSKTYLAHRSMFASHYNDTEFDFLKNICGNKDCVNPKHWRKSVRRLIKDILNTEV